MSLNERSSSFGGGIIFYLRSSSSWHSWIVAVRTVHGRQARRRRSNFVVLVLQVEREHQVALVVLARDHVLDPDVEAVRLDGVGRRAADHLLDPRLELVDRLLAVD